MLFHIQVRGPTGWEAFGSGVGSGPEPEVEAMRELRRTAGGLPAGTYRVVAARTGVPSGFEFAVDACGGLLGGSRASGGDLSGR